MPVWLRIDMTSPVAPHLTGAQSSPRPPRVASNLRPLLRLVNQQFWLFGHDVRRPEGNILLDLGFEKSRPPTESPITSSRYRCTLTSGLTIALWGFGMYLSAHPHTGLFVSRNGLHPFVHTTGDLLATTWNPWDAGLLRSAEDASDREVIEMLLPQAVAWIGDYEQTILDRYGLDYRIEALAHWKRPCCPADALVTEWARIHRGLTEEVNRPPSPHF
jgi:hypothetical protein